MKTPSNSPQTKRVGMFVFEDFEPLDVWGPIEAFAIARFIGTDYYTQAPRPFDIVLISNECRAGGGGAPAPVSCYGGPRVAPDLFRDDALAAEIDILMIPGGKGIDTLLGASDSEVAALVEWVRAMNDEVELMTSVCTGAALLAYSGLLDGVHAATNHEAFAWVTSKGPRVRWDNVSRWVHDGHFVTSAGVSAGTDMAFHIVSYVCGRAVAEKAALAAEYHWHRDPEAPIPFPQQAAVPTARGRAASIGADPA